MGAEVFDDLFFGVFEGLGVDGGICGELRSGGLRCRGGESLAACHNHLA